MTYRFHVLLLLLATVGALASCESTTGTTPAPFDSTIVNTGDRALFIVDEGHFQSNNSSMDAIVFRTTTAVDTVSHKDVLTGLGEGNDIWLVGNRAYILDNGGQIVIANADSLKKIGSIPLGITQPDKMALIGAGRFVVTERSGSSAKVVDVNAAKIVDSLPVADGSVCVGVLAGKVFITSEPSTSRGSMSVFDANSKALINTISLDANPEDLVVDSVHNQIIVGCSGDYNMVAPSAAFIDASNLAVKKKITLGAVGDQFAFVLGPQLYVLVSSAALVVDLSTYANAAVPIPGGNSYYNGIYDAKTNALYLGRTNYTSAGTVDVFDATSMKIRWSFKTGIAPAHFAFYH